MKNKVFLAALLGAVMGTMLFGCDHRDSDVSSEKKVTEEPRATEETKEEEQKSEEDGEKVAGKETKYEETFAKAVQIDGKKEKVQVLQNPEDVTDTKIMVGDSDVEMERISIGAGYSMAQVKTHDYTGDGREEIILKLQGGASGAYNEVQILAEEEGRWKEVPFPKELWEEDCISFKKEGKRVKIAVSGTKEEKVVSDSSDDKWGRRYRTCKIDKDGQMIIVYHIYRGEDINNIVGKVKLTMHYDQAAKAFKIGKTAFSF